MTSIAGSNSTIRSSDFETAQTGHHEVREHDLRMLAKHNLDTLLGILRGEDAETGPRQSGRKQFQTARIIVDMTRETLVSALIVSPFPPAVLADGAPQIRHLYWLADVGGKSGCNRPFTVAGHRAGRKGHDRNARIAVFGAQALKNAKAVSMRHVEIENDEIGLRFECAVNRLSPVTRFDNSVARRREDRADQLPACVAVLCYQYCLRQ